MYSDSGAPLREERVTTVRKKPHLHLELYLSSVTGGMRTPIVPCDSQHVTLHGPSTPRDQGFHQREIVHEDAEGCRV